MAAHSFKNNGGYKNDTNGDIALPSQDGSEVYQFNPQGRHLRTLDALTGVPLYTFAYDTAGRLTSELDNGTTTSYSYDATGQLTQAGSQSYSYDANGNRNGTGGGEGTPRARRQRTPTSATGSGRARSR